MTRKGWPHHNPGCILDEGHNGYCRTRRPEAAALIPAEGDGRMHAIRCHLPDWHHGPCKTSQQSTTTYVDRMRYGVDVFNAPQPAPVNPPITTAIWPLVIADMRARNDAGIRKYGTALQANNGRDALIDAYQEALDLSVYLRQAIQERDSK